MSQLTLYNFESKIPQTIIHRGKSYFKSGAIEHIQELGEGIWNAQVSGSRAEDYIVSIEISPNGTLTDYDCTCSNQDFCKHIACVLFQIKDDKTASLPFPNAGRAFTQAALSKSDILELARAARLENMEQRQQQAVQPAKITPTPTKTPNLKTQNEADFFKNYTQIPLIQQRLLLIMSLLWDTAAHTPIWEIFRDADFKNDGKSTVGQEILAELEDLRIIGMVHRNNNQFSVKKEYAQPLCEAVYAAKNNDFNAILPILRKKFNNYWNYSYSDSMMFRDMRIGRYADDLSYFREKFSSLIRSNLKNWPEEKLFEFWFPEGKFVSILEDMRHNFAHFFLQIRLTQTLLSLEKPDMAFTYACQKLSRFEGEHRKQLLLAIQQICLLQGDFDTCKDLNSKYADEFTQSIFEANLAFLMGENERALAFYQIISKELRRVSKNQKATLTGLNGVFHALALLKKQAPDDLRTFDKLVEQNQKIYDVFNSIFSALQAVRDFLNNKKAQVESVVSRNLYREDLGGFFWNVAAFLIDEKLVDIEKIKNLQQKFSKNAYRWLAAETFVMLADLDQKQYEEERDNALADLQIEPIVWLFPRVEAWETALNALLNLGKTQTAKTAKDNDQRLVWLVNFDKKQLEAKEQTYGKNGWTAGRTIGQERLMGGKLGYMSTQDRLLIEHCTSYYGLHYLESNMEVWKTLVGHPYLFLEKSPEVAVQFVEEKPVLLAQNTKDGYELKFSPPIDKAKGFKIIKETPTRYKFIEITAELARIAEALDGKSIFVPEKAAERLTETVKALSGIVEVQSVLLANDENTQIVEPDSRPHVHLLPVGDGFHVEFLVKPFSQVPPYFRPGEGDQLAMTLQEGQRLRTDRDLKTEKKQAEKLREQIPTLKNTRRSKNGVWEIEDANTCLELLTDLDPHLRSEDIVLEWPKGEKYRINKVLGLDDFRMKIRAGGGSQWFEVEGTLPIDEGKVLTMQELIELSQRAKNQFIELSPGHFVALTAEFRRRLKQINGLLGSKRDGTLTLHPLAASAFSPMTEALQHLDADEAFVQNHEKLRAAFAKKFKVPKKFKADLRPYQQEGFEWLHRLAEWGVGACLADDMGLGKTIQALAFLTDRANLGPALVAAPASVCRNWVVEIEKFAPALKAVLFGEGDREAVLRAAKKGDVVIVTYDLMTREAKQFLEKKWATVILDEAQAIKNHATKRSETVMQLQTDFRLAMSGTPIENHLGELWNLFQFTNPGLLGSLEDFNKKYALQIEKYRDDDRRDQLKRLVQPFILRRRKDEVLKELPAKTEITLSVQLTPEERAFYEALRRKALDNLENSDEGGGERHLKILAEIMKLRRAACHPKLADSNATHFLESSKLRLFGEVVSELLENGHKALVFSQFVGHLEILEDFLKKNNIKYQYLDGSTPLATRQKRIEKFQNGEGDLFLISLKAGGTGLNLTAADYVLHMDPWWNPAVEDQATDRAHRIGQDKPVTVYRLVAEGTIEEKILRLHEQKRDLADSLLEGTGASAKLSADDLMNLLRGN